MLSSSITEQQENGNGTLCTQARNNGFPLQIIHNLKYILRQKTKNSPTQAERKKWITYTYHSPLILKVTYLFKSTDVNVPFRTCNTIYNKLCDRTPQNKINSIGIYKLQCKTCNKSYVGQAGSSVEIRHREHIY